MLIYYDSADRVNYSKISNTLASRNVEYIKYHDAVPEPTSKEPLIYSAAVLTMPFSPSAACKNLDLPPVNLRFLHLHLTKNSFVIAPPH